MGQLRPLFRSFSSFQANTTILTTNKCEKMPIQCQDSNSQPSDYESPPLTTRPGHNLTCLYPSRSTAFGHHLALPLSDASAFSADGRKIHGRKIPVTLSLRV